MKRAFERVQDAVHALIKNKIDAFVYDAPIICYYAPGTKMIK